MIISSFSWFGRACGNDANPTVSQREGHGKDPPVNHPDDAVTVLAIIHTVVQALNPEAILKDTFGGLEAHAMLSIVLNGLGFIPFEVLFAHDSRD